MNIGEAARKAGVSAKMIRHYEEKGLLKPVTRSESGYRQYDQTSVDELCFIRQARILGFSIRQIEELLKLYRNPLRPSKEVRALAQQHLAEVDKKMRELSVMKETLEQLISSCSGDDDPNCTILKQLSTSRRL